MRTPPNQPLNPLGLHAFVTDFKRKVEKSHPRTC